MHDNWQDMISETRKATCRAEVQQLCDYLLHNKTYMDDPSLFKGKTGIALLFAYYSLAENDARARDYVYELIESILNDMAAKPLNFSYLTGISGIHWGLQHINRLFNNELFEPDFFDETATHLAAFLHKKMEEKNYDLLYGALGAYVSLTESPEQTARFDHAAFCDKLIALSTYERNGTYLWIDTISPGFNNTVNLGMAHGMPCLWYMLSVLYKRCGDERVLSILPASYHTVSQYPMLNDESLFPNDLFFDEQLNERQPVVRRSSMLSWCYGDISIANSLVTSGINTGNDALVNEGIRIGLQSLTRDTIEKAGLRDPCLCHGTTSCIHIYNRLYHYTGHPAFKQAVTHWFDLGLSYRKANGYNLLELEDDDSPLEILEHSLLDGYVGIALTYLSLYSGIEPQWDRALLLS
jgi:lantibiotic modifying enzyme